MPTFIVLLRGVNVGKTRRVPMADFKALLIELGCSSVVTLLASGNAVVDAPRQSANALARKVEGEFPARFGFAVPVVVKSATELDDVVAGNPLSDREADPSRLLVAFAQQPATLAALKPLAELVSPRERFALLPAAAYLYCADGILESRAATRLLGRTGEAITTRNWATVLKLQALTQRGSRTPASPAGR